MEQALKEKALAILDENRITSVATLRDDGWPQTTTVGFANDGLRLYFLCGRGSQKAKNIAADDRISLTVDHDVSDPMAITGLSMAARAAFADDDETFERAMALMLKKYPEYAGMPIDRTQLHLVRVTPKIISVLDYSKGFGHADTVEVNEADLT